MTASIERSLEVALGARSYRIDIGRGLLRSADAFEGLAPPAATAAIVSNETVAPLYAAALAASLAPHFRHVVRIVLPDGEATKTLATFERIQSELLAARLDRRSVVFALGGGVVGDLAGFAAGCFQRGIDFVQVPTTLLAQVDSSVGGKTGVNHAAGKNMIGVFHQPRRVVVDLETLATLPARELTAGLAEVIKIGAVADAGFLAWMEAHVGDLRRLEPAALTHAIGRSCELKAAIVGADERESGVRATLNFGHTFAHAIEAHAGYGGWLHGEAVGCGMAMAADLSARLGLLDRAEADRLHALIGTAGLPLRPPPLAADEWIERMRGDKKAEGGELRFVVLESPGRAVLRGVPGALLRETLSSFAHAA